MLYLGRLTALVLFALLTSQSALMHCAAAQPSKSKEPRRPGLPPIARGACSPSHPIKGNFTTKSGERCIYHLPGQRWYGKTHPERCYATEEEARQDGCRKSKV